MNDRKFLKHYLTKFSAVVLVVSFLLVTSMALPGASGSGMSVNSTSTPAPKYLPLIFKLFDPSIPSPTPTLEPIKLFFSPPEASIPPDTTVSLMLDAKANDIGFVQVEVSFDNSIINLTDEVQVTDLLKTVVVKTGKNEANSTGRAAIVLGLSTDESSSPPTGLFEIARLSLGAVTEPQNQNTSLSVNNLAVQIVNLSPAELPFSSDSAIIHISTEPSPTYMPTPTETPSSGYIKWGTFGSGPGQFNDPDGIATDAGGNVYVVDRLNYRIQIFSASGDFLGSWGSEGSADGQFLSPRGIAADESGFVYVVDENQHRVRKFTSNGSFVTSWGIQGNGNGEFFSPAGVTTGGGFVYVADTYNHRIQKFTADGSFVSKWGSEGSGDGEFNLPYASAIDKYGDVYIVDRWNHRIQKFTSNGEFILSWSNGFYGPRGMFVTDQDTVYVTDSGNHTVQVFETDGTFIRSWGSQGTGDGEFDEPIGTTVNQWGVYVVDSKNNRIQRFPEE